MKYWIKYLFVIFILFLPSFLFSQNQDCDIIYSKEQVDKPAKFKSKKEDGLLWYIASQLRYPKDALENRIQGTVVLELIINTEGRVINITVKQSVWSSLDKEAIRVSKSMPKWEPALKDGNPVCMQYIIPVNFTVHSF